MISKIKTRFAVGFVAVLFPAAAFADLTGTLTLPANTSVSMDTGSIVSSGGDFLWNGTTLAPQGSVKAFDVTTSVFGSSFSGTTGYSALSATILQGGLSAGLGSGSPLSGLAVNHVVGYQTNGGNLGKLLVTSVSGGTLVFQYTTYGVSGTGGGGTTPTITSVQNNYSNIVAGLPNSGIAPSTIFAIYGKNLAGTATAVSSAPPGIPSTLSGASVAVTVNGTTVHPGLYYASAGQINAVLPAATPIGSGTVTVTYNGIPSNSVNITVAPSTPGLASYASGIGLAIADDLNYNLINYTNSAKPGQNIILWGSGFGADTADSDTTVTTTPHASSVPVTIYIGGIAVTPAYVGSDGYPGQTQINVAIPSLVPTGCGVSVVAVSGSSSTTIVSNTVTLPISASGGTCNDPLTGISGSTISTLTGKSNYNSGDLFVLQSTNAGKPTNIADGVFQNVQTTSSSTVSGLTSVGSCTLTTSSTILTAPTSTSTGLDAGTITITGPAGSQTLTAVPSLPGDYVAQLSSGFIPATGGSYTFTGTGGAQVGAFSVSVSYANPLVWTNSGSITAVNRASGQPITWTGGASGSYVFIEGGSSSSTASANFTCYALANAGQFTVPAYVLLGLPVGNGTLGVENITTPVSFSASGLDFAAAFAGVGVSISPTYN